MGIAFDFNELRGRIIAKYGTQAAFARALGVSRSVLSGKLNNRVAFKPDEILRVCSSQMLDIQPVEIGRYFFTPKV